MQVPATSGNDAKNVKSLVNQGFSGLEKARGNILATIFVYPFSYELSDSRNLIALFVYRVIGGPSRKPEIGQI